MTESQCKARLARAGSSRAWYCVLSEGHEGDHKTHPDFYLDDADSLIAELDAAMRENCACVRVDGSFPYPTLRVLNALDRIGEQLRAGAVHSDRRATKENS